MCCVIFFLPPGPPKKDDQTKPNQAFIEDSGYLLKSV